MAAFVDCVFAYFYYIFTNRFKHKRIVSALKIHNDNSLYIFYTFV